jgi:hypothetical protein
MTNTEVGYCGEGASPGRFISLAKGIEFRYSSVQNRLVR